MYSLPFTEVSVFRSSKHVPHRHVYLSTPHSCAVLPTIGQFWIHLDTSHLGVHSVSLSFRLRLSLSVNGQMVIWLFISHLNYRSAIHTQKYKYFEMSGQIAIQLLSIKKAQIFLNSQMAVQLYTSHSAVHTQTQTQTESEAFKTHSLVHCSQL